MGVWLLLGSPDAVRRTLGREVGSNSRAVEILAEGAVGGGDRLTSSEDDSTSPLGTARELAEGRGTEGAPSELNEGIVEG